MKRVNAGKYAPQTVPDVGLSGFTPSSDGQLLYTWFGDGVAACYDLEGRRRWIRVDRRAAVEHGFSSSPLLIGGKFVVFMRDLMAFQAASGKLAWQIPVAEREGLNPGRLLPWLAGRREDRLDARRRAGQRHHRTGRRRQGALRRPRHGQTVGRLSGGRGESSLLLAYRTLGTPRVHAPRPARRSAFPARPQDRRGPDGLSQALSALALVVAGNPPGAGLPDEQRGRAYGGRRGGRKGALPEAARPGSAPGP